MLSEYVEPAPHAGVGCLVEQFIARYHTSHICRCLSSVYDWHAFRQSCTRACVIYIALWDPLIGGSGNDSSSGDKDGVDLKADYTEGKGIFMSTYGASTPFDLLQVFEGSDRLWLEQRMLESLRDSVSRLTANGCGGGLN